MFEGSFYTLIHCTPNEAGYTAEVELVADHAVYAGHFPSQPVVPGVCTLTVLRELTSRAVGHKLCFRSIRECKYLSALIPKAGLRLMIDATLTEQSLRCVVVSEGRTVLKLTAETALCDE